MIVLNRVEHSFSLNVFFKQGLYVAEDDLADYGSCFCFGAVEYSSLFSFSLHFFEGCFKGGDFDAEWLEGGGYFIFVDFDLKDGGHGLIETSQHMFYSSSIDLLSYQIIIILPEQIPQKHFPPFSFLSFGVALVSIRFSHC